MQKYFYYIFAVGYSLGALLHFVGLVLLCKVKTKFVNQRMITVHLAVTEMLNCLVQASVVVTGLAKYQVYELYVVFQFFIVFSIMNSKLIMMYVTLDRLLDILLHMKYTLYFTKRRVMMILSVLWCVSITTGITASILIQDVRNREIRIRINEIRNYLFFTLDMFITLNAVITYTCLYMKVRKALHNTHTPAGQNGGRQNPLAKFVVPCVLVSTYIVFNVTGSTLKMIQYLNPKNREMIILVFISGLLIMVGWMSDAFVYIFAQRDVRLYLISLVRKPAQAPTPLSMRSMKTSTTSVVGKSYHQFNHWSTAEFDDNNGSKNVNDNSKNTTMHAVENLGYIIEEPNI